MKIYSERRRVSKTGRVYYPRVKEQKKKANDDYYAKHGEAVKQRIRLAKFKRMEVKNPRKETLMELNLTTEEVETMRSNAKDESLRKITAYYDNLLSKINNLKISTDV